MPKPHNNRGLRRIYNAFFFSMDGIKACLKSEEAFRIEMILALFFIPFGLWYGHTAVEKVLLVGSILFLLIVELMNTAIERSIDRISYDHHLLSKEAKDMGSATVLLATILTGLTWGLIVFF